MARYVVIGAGAVGVTIAVELQRAGRDAVLVARGAQLDALAAGALRYVRPDGEHRVTPAVVGGPDELELRADDVLVLATKTQDADAALATWAWQPVTRADGTTAPAAEALALVTTQNGPDADRSALRRFATVIGGVLFMRSGYVAPGEVVMRTGPAVGVLWLGRFPAGGDERLPAMAEDLRAAGFEVQLVDDVARFKAAKLVISTGFALDALYPLTELRQRAAELLRDEARAVLAAAGTPVADLRAEATVRLDRFQTRAVDAGEQGVSTWQSLVRAGSLETDHLNGEIVLAARLAGTTAPANAAIVARIRRAAREGTAPRSLDDADLRRTLPPLDASPS